MKQSSLQEIKAMFASEHVTVVVGGLLETQYFYARTKKPMSKRKALEILAGNY